MTNAEIDKALKGAVRCLESIERNQAAIEGYVRKGEPGAASAIVSMIEGWKRNLEHARRLMNSYGI